MLIDLRSEAESSAIEICVQNTYYGGIDILICSTIKYVWLNFSEIDAN